MSEEKRKKERREKMGRRSEEERRKAPAGWDGRDWQPDSDANSGDDKRQNARRQEVLEHRTEMNAAGISLFHGGVHFRRSIIAKKNPSQP